MCLLLLPILVPAADKVSPERIGGLFASIESGNAPGAAVLVLHNGRMAFQRGYGVTDLQTQNRIDPHTNFRLASVTKQFTAMAIMLLVHDGKLSYDARLADIIPGFPEYARAVSVRNLLNHTSGLPDYEELMHKNAPKTELEQVPQIQGPVAAGAWTRCLLLAGDVKISRSRNYGAFRAEGEDLRNHPRSRFQPIARCVRCYEG